MSRSFDSPVQLKAIKLASHNFPFAIKDSLIVPQMENISDPTLIVCHLKN